MTTTKKILRTLGLAALLAASGGAQAQSPMAYELAGAPTGSGAISADAYPHIDRVVFRIKGSYR